MLSWLDGHSFILLDHLYTDHEIDILHREVRVYSVFSLLQALRVDILHIKSECDILQNPGFEVYHIHSEVYHVAMTWHNRCLDLKHAYIARRIRNVTRHSMLTTSKGQKDHYYRQVENHIVGERYFHAHPQLLLRSDARVKYINLADPYKNKKVDVLHFYEVYTSLICLAYQIAPFRVKYIE